MEEALVEWYLSLDEQCVVSPSGSGVEIAVKAAKQIPSDSLQNPSAPDAGHSRHKGHNEVKN